MEKYTSIKQDMEKFALMEFTDNRKGRRLKDRIANRLKRRIERRDARLRA